MPTRVKWMWVICSLFIFFGSIYLSIKNEIEESGAKARQERANKIEKPDTQAKKFQQEAFRISRKIKGIGELIALGKHAKAGELAQEVLAKNPDNALAYTWWGIALVKTNHLNEAIGKFDQAGRLDPTQAKTFLYWGLTLNLQEKYDEAISKFQTAIQLDPENSKAYANWGGSLVRLGKYQEAITGLQKALNINPFNQIAYGVLVDSFYHTQQYKKAWEIVLKARKRRISIAKASLRRLALAMPEPAP